MAFAKVRWNDQETPVAEALCRKITDWDGFLDTALRNFSLPSMRRHLASMANDCVPQEVKAAIDDVADASAMRNLMLISGQSRFQEICLGPLGAEAIFFKGMNLVGKYYPDLGLRPCRDVDVLVRPDALRPIVLRAIDNGYDFVVPGQSDRPLVASSEIDAALQYRSDAILLSPEGVAIDLQTSLDKYSGIFAQEDLFSQTAPVALGGKTFQTMSPALLFNYICHHHARHVWSRLHWLSDLDAMIVAPDFDRHAVLETSDRLGHRGTIEASLEMQSLMSPVASWENSEDNWRGLKFLELSLRNLSGDLDLEKSIGFRMQGGEFMFDWQADQKLIRRARRRHLRKILRPTVRQYVRFPLPSWLRWLYVFPRFVHVIGRTRDRVSRGVE